MELLCIQSQEHPKLPQGELKAVIECEQMQTNLEVITEGLVILKDISPENLDDYYQILTRRLGYTHEVHQILKTSDISNLNEDILSISPSGSCGTRSHDCSARGSSFREFQKHRG